MSTEEVPTGLELPPAGGTTEPARTDAPSSVEGLTVEEAVTLYEVSLSTLRRRLQKRVVPGAVQVPSPKGLVWRIPPESLEALGYKPKQIREAEVKAAKVSLEAEGLEARVKELEAAIELERVRREAAENVAAILQASLDNSMKDLDALRDALAKIPAALPAGKPARWWRKKPS